MDQMSVSTERHLRSIQLHEYKCYSVSAECVNTQQFAKTFIVNTL